MTRTQLPGPTGKSDSLAVIVCGSRDWTDRRAIYRVLDEAQPSVVLTGGARGADAIAEEWCRLRMVPCVRMPAQWGRDGRQAGPLRNQAMLDVLLLWMRFGYNGEVHGFPLPHGSGTQDMMRRARQSAVAVGEHIA